MTSIMLKNDDLNDKWWIELIKTINYFRNRFSMINKSIIFFRNKHETKILFCSFSSNWDNKLRHETQINHEMKKAYFQIVLCRTCKLRKKSHLSNAAFQRNHLSSLVHHLNQWKAKKIINYWDFIDETINHRINYILDQKTNFEIEFRNHSHRFVSAQLINYRCFILFDFLNSEN
jgi:hypothetical protein